MRHLSSQLQHASVHATTSPSLRVLTCLLCNFCHVHPYNVHIENAGALKKGSHVVIKGFPCKVAELSTSKTGKHGHAKVNMVGLDIFTGKKYEDISPSSHNMDQPVVVRKDYQLIDIDDDGYITIMDDKHETRSDLHLDDTDEVHVKAKDDFVNGKDLIVTVLSALGSEKVIAAKELQN